MKTIAYYVSDYGYGHAARSIAVIRSLLHKDPSIKIVVCCSFAMNFIQASLRLEDPNRIDYHTVENDFGYILEENSIEADIVGMNRQYDQFIHGIGNYVEQEQRYIKNIGVDLVITDISPLPILAAKSLDIPVMGVSNFTWYTAYQDIISSRKLEALYEAYNQMDHFIPLSGANEPQWSGNVHNPVDFYCREINPLRVEEIRKQIDPQNEYFLVYFGLGMKIGVNDLSDLKLWASDKCLFIVSGNTPVEGENIFKIPSDVTETQNYLAACDLIISKPGWGTVSEAIQARKPLLLLERSNFMEDRNMIEYLRRKQWCHLLTWRELDKFKITDSFQKEMGELAKRIQPVTNEVVLDRLTDEIRDVLSFHKEGDHTCDSDGNI